MFPRSAWDALVAKVDTLPMGDQGARTFQRFLFSSTFEIEIDRQGRVVLPANLREWAGLGNEAVLVGGRDHIELWQPGRWAEYSREMNSPEVLSRHLQGLGI